MRILFVVPDFYPSNSGYGNACTGFVRALLSHSPLEVDVLSFVPLGGKNEFTHPRLRVFRIQERTFLGKPNLIGSERALWEKTRELYAQHSYDFVIFETAEFPFTVNLALKHIGPQRVIVRIHATAETEWALFRRTPVYRLKRRPTIQAFRNLKYIFSTTHYYLNFTKKHFLSDNPLLIASKYYEVIPNIVATPEDQAPSDQAKALINGAQHDGIVFLTLGRMDAFGEQQKNFTRLIIALAQLKDRPYFNRIQLIAIGKGDFRPKLEKLAAGLGLGNTIRFLDALPNADIQYLQRTCHGVVLPSTFEGLSMFALESLSNSAALLFARAGGLIDLVDHGKNGVLYDPLEPADIAEKMDLFIRDLLPDLETARQHSRKKFAEQFESETIVATFVDRLHTLSLLRS